MVTCDGYSPSPPLLSRLQQKRPVQHQYLPTRDEEMKYHVCIYPSRRPHIKELQANAVSTDHQHGTDQPRDEHRRVSDVDQSHREIDDERDFRNDQIQHTTDTIPWSVPEGDGDSGGEYRQEAHRVDRMVIRKGRRKQEKRRRNGEQPSLAI